MLETHAQFAQTQPNTPYPQEDLRRYRYHTGAPLTPLDPDEVCPVLFRDIGPAAMATFLRSGVLPRLAGPLSPIGYMRTADYAEPYVDHGQIGRLVLLRPLTLAPWHSGIATIYIASASRPVHWPTIAFVPGALPLRDAAHELALVRDRRELREVYGGCVFDDVVADTLGRLDHLQHSLSESERLAGPLRGHLQKGDRTSRKHARKLLESTGLTEGDLCSAWHHISASRRDFIQRALEDIAGPIDALGAAHPAAQGRQP